MKKRNQKGFTIMEMLIVVAIIAILVAIAIPTFNSALTKSKEAADVANIRAAYAEMMMDYMMDGTKLTTEEIKKKIQELTNALEDKKKGKPSGQRIYCIYNFQTEEHCIDCA